MVGWMIASIVIVLTWNRNVADSRHLLCQGSSAAVNKQTLFLCWQLRSVFRFCYFAVQWMETWKTESTVLTELSNKRIYSTDRGTKICFFFISMLPHCCAALWRWKVNIFFWKYIKICIVALNLTRMKTWQARYSYCVFCRFCVLGPNVYLLQTLLVLQT
jgi:hypothetical protein